MFQSHFSTGRLWPGRGRWGSYSPESPRCRDMARLPHWCRSTSFSSWPVCLAKAPASLLTTYIQAKIYPSQKKNTQSVLGLLGPFSMSVSTILRGFVLVLSSSCMDGSMLLWRGVLVWWSPGPFLDQSCPCFLDSLGSSWAPWWSAGHLLAPLWPALTLLGLGEGLSGT